jgi:hypothetical protein
MYNVRVVSAVVQNFKCYRLFLAKIKVKKCCRLSSLPQRIMILVCGQFHMKEISYKNVGRCDYLHVMIVFIRKIIGPIDG